MTETAASSTKEGIAQQRDALFANGSKFKPTTREQIVGIDDVLNELDDVIHWLRFADQYQEHDSRLEPGIILAGEPGTGKTSSARYIATKSEALFVNVRDFPHEGELFKDSDIRDLFARARTTYESNKKPVVLFWDEFEGVGAERGATGTTASEAAVVSQLTSELEGALGKNEGILLIGCTNYLSHIDHALRRRGRMGLQLEFHAPDREGKEKILNYYLSKMNTAEDIDTETLSHFFAKHATAADIEEACMEAWRHAVKRAIEAEGTTKPLIAEHDLIKVFIKHLVGPATTYTLPKEERKRVAIHEAGHAIVAMAFGVKVRLITVQPGKRALGRVIVDDMMEYIASKDEVADFIRLAAGGIAAERAAGLPEMVGSSGDIANMNKQAQRLIDRLGYDSEIGLYNIGTYGGARKGDGPYEPACNPSISEVMVARSDRAIKNLIDQLTAEAFEVMENVGAENLWELAERLNETVTMTGAEFEDLVVEVTGLTPAAFNPSMDLVQVA